jgi:hypothetical protein
VKPKLSTSKNACKTKRPKPLVLRNHPMYICTCTCRMFEYTEIQLYISSRELLRYHIYMQRAYMNVCTCICTNVIMSAPMNGGEDYYGM